MIEAMVPTPAEVDALTKQTLEELQKITAADKKINENAEFQKTFAHVRLFAMLSTQLGEISNTLKSIDKRLEKLETEK